MKLPMKIVVSIVMQRDTPVVEYQADVKSGFLSINRITNPVLITDSQDIFTAALAFYAPML